MNRQIRRAQEKSDKKREKEQGNRNPRRASASPGSSTPKKQRKSSGNAAGATLPGRFAGVFALVAVLLIASQALLPAPEMTIGEYIISALSYSILGYFLCLWLVRRAQPRALLITAAAGLMLSVGVESARFVQPDMTPFPLLIALAFPAAVLGGVIAKWIFSKAQEVD